MPWLFNPPAVYPAFAVRVPPWIGFPHSPTTPTESTANKDVDEDMEALSQKLRDRWKFDPDTVSNGTEHGGRAIIDDFDYRYLTPMRFNPVPDSSFSDKAYSAMLL
jgi:hypothetical protein